MMMAFMVIISVVSMNNGKNLCSQFSILIHYL